MTQPPVDKETMPNEVWAGQPRPDGLFTGSIYACNGTRYVLPNPSQTVEPMDIEGLKRELYNHFCPAFKKYDPHAYIKLSDVIDHLHVTNRLMIGNEIPKGWKCVPFDKPITNEMKSECIGEYSFKVDRSCSACHFGEPDEDCEVCAGEIEYSEEITVPWDLCKKIYKGMLTAAPDTKAGGEK